MLSHVFEYVAYIFFTSQLIIQYCDLIVILIVCRYPEGDWLRMYFYILVFLLLAQMDMSASAYFCTTKLHFCSF